MEMHERLREARKNAGFRSASAAAEALGVSPGTYLGHENGSRSFDVDTAKRYARRFKVTTSWLLMEEGPMRYVVDHPEWAGGDRPEGDSQAEDVSGDAFYSDAAPYRPRLAGARPELDVAPGAGHGSLGDEGVVAIGETTVSGHKVRAEWVIPEAFYRYELNASPNGSVLLPVVGDSMSPSINPGDRVIIDTKQNYFGPDGVYVFDEGDGEPRVKRLQKILRSNQVAVISDNSIHQTQNIDIEELRIIGRVVGRIHRM